MSVNVTKQDLLIDADEFKFLSEILNEVEDNDSHNLEYGINSFRGGDELLLQLGAAQNLQLVANYEKYHLIFPLKIKKGDFTNFNLQFNSPEIFERGDKLRSWRLPADKRMRLVNEAGEESDFQLKDISASGISILLDDHNHTKFPEELNNMYLLLPDRERLAISGAYISRIDDKAIAYSLGNETDELVFSSLSEYLYECHTQLYPDALSLRPNNIVSLW